MKCFDNFRKSIKILPKKHVCCFQKFSKVVMIIEERYQKILAVLDSKKIVSYQELADTLYCSLSTIRRDIEAMAKKGMLEKVRNGAAKIEGSASESPFIVRESENIEDKRMIAEKARTLLAPGCTMFLDSSTTCAQMIPLLQGLPSLTVITNGIENALLLAHQGIEVHIPSGILSGTNSAVIGSSCLEYIERFSPDFAFLSARGLSEDGFISEATEASRDIKKAMIARAKKVVLLIDASKIGKTYFAETCSLSEIDMLITNGLLPQSLMDICQKNQVEVIANS